MIGSSADARFAVRTAMVNSSTLKNPLRTDDQSTVSSGQFITWAAANGHKPTK